MATKDVKLNLTDKRLLSAKDLGDYWYNLFTQWFKDIETDYSYPSVNFRSARPGACFESEVDIGDAGGPNSITFPLTAQGNALDGLGNRLNWIASGIYPFENAGGVTYYVTANGGIIPKDVQANPRTADYEYTSVEEVVGYNVPPDSVIDLGGNLRLNIDTATEPGVSNQSRFAWVFLNAPETGDILVALEYLPVQWDGLNNYVVTSAYLGQTIPSTVAGNYVVCLDGPRILRNTPSNKSTPGTFYVGTVIGGATPRTYSYLSQQNVIVAGGLTGLGNITEIGPNGDLKVAVKSHPLDAGTSQIAVIHSPTASRVFQVTENGNIHLNPFIPGPSPMITFDNGIPGQTFRIQEQGAYVLTIDDNLSATGPMQLNLQNSFGSDMFAFIVDGPIACYDTIQTIGPNPLYLDDVNCPAPIPLSDGVTPLGQTFINGFQFNNLLASTNAAHYKDIANVPGIFEDPSFAINGPGTGVTYNDIFGSQGPQVWYTGAGLLDFTGQPANTYYVYMDATGTLQLSTTVGGAFTGIPLFRIDWNGAALTNLLEMYYLRSALGSALGSFTVSTDPFISANFKNLSGGFEWMKGLIAIGAAGAPKKFTVIGQITETSPIFIRASDGFTGLTVEGICNNDNGTNGEIVWTHDGPCITIDAENTINNEYTFKGLRFVPNSPVSATGNLVPIEVRDTVGLGKIAGLTIEKCFLIPGSSVYAIGFLKVDSTRIEPLIMRDCLVQYSDYGIRARSGDSAGSDRYYIEHNRFQQSGGIAVTTDLGSILLHGYGTILNNAINQPYFGIDLEPTSYLTVKGNELALSSTAGQPRGIRLQGGSQNAYIEKNTVIMNDNVNNIGIYTTTPAHIEGNTVVTGTTAANQIGIYCNGGINARTTVIDNIVNGFSDEGIYVDTGKYVLIGNNTISTTALAASGIRIDTPEDKVRIIGNLIECPQYGIELPSGSNITDLLIEDNNIKVEDQYGLFLLNLIRATIKGNTITGDAGCLKGTYISGNAITPSNIVINDNQFYNFEEDAIYLLAVDYGQVSHNQITQINGPNCNGINFASASTYFLVHGNVFSNLIGVPVNNAIEATLMGNGLISDNVNAVGYGIAAAGSTVLANNT